MSDVAVMQGSMTLNGNELGFSLSMFSDENPAMLRGSYGSYEAAVQLRIDEIRYESPAAHTVPGSPNALEGSVTGTLRGTLRDRAGTRTARRQASSTFASTRTR